ASPVSASPPAAPTSRPPSTSSPAARAKPVARPACSRRNAATGTNPSTSRARWRSCARSSVDGRDRLVETLLQPSQLEGADEQDGAGGGRHEPALLVALVAAAGGRQGRGVGARRLARPGTFGARRG